MGIKFDLLNINLIESPLLKANNVRSSATARGRDPNNQRYLRPLTRKNSLSLAPYQIIEKSLLDQTTMKSTMTYLLSKISCTPKIILPSGVKRLQDKKSICPYNTRLGMVLPESSTAPQSKNICLKSSPVHRETDSWLKEEVWCKQTAKM